MCARQGVWPSWPDQVLPGGSNGVLHGLGLWQWAAGSRGEEMLASSVNWPWMKHTGGASGRISGFGLNKGRVVDLELRYYDEW